MTDCRHHQLCIESALQKAQEICAQDGVRLTPLRQRVLMMIWQGQGDDAQSHDAQSHDAQSHDTQSRDGHATTHQPSKAYDILHRLSAEHGSAKPPTVYRALDFLLAHGLIHRLDSLNAYVGCVHPLQHQHCYFLICQQCQQVQECCSEQLNQAMAQASDAYQFSSKNVTLEIAGLCQTCQ